MWCWWCCHPFEGLELHLPYKYDSHRKKFDTMGCFCSWSCMKTYNMTYNRVRASIISGNIVLMYKQMHDRIAPIKCAPNRYALKVFGGTLTIEEFRKLSESGPRVHVRMPDEVYHIQEVVAKYEVKAPTEGNLDAKFQEVSRSSTNNETLKIKRQKPLKRDANNLEKTLGITRISK